MQRPLYQQQDPELRRLKESFVSNLHGTTRWEVFCVLSSLPLCLLVGELLRKRLDNSHFQVVAGIRVQQQWEAVTNSKAGRLHAVTPPPRPWQLPA